MLSFFHVKICSVAINVNSQVLVLPNPFLSFRSLSLCVCVCVCVCARARARVCVCPCVWACVCACVCVWRGNIGVCNYCLAAFCLSLFYAYIYALHTCIFCELSTAIGDASVMSQQKNWIESLEETNKRTKERKKKKKKTCWTFYVIAPPPPLPRNNVTCTEFPLQWIP